MEFDNWILYLFAAVGLSLSPGPNGLLALTHGAQYGCRKTLFTIFGGSLGFVFIMTLSMFGIGALIKASVLWLTALKWIGGAYLVWLGVHVWRSPPIAVEASRDTSTVGGGLLFRQGALSAATNPKGILFFCAFLPLFIDPDRSLPVQFAMMTATFIATEVLTELALASAANRIRPWLARVGRRFNRACGGLFIAIGAALPLRN
ncbi:MAG: LysE family translocator [Burkholderiaceae bacterium]